MCVRMALIKPVVARVRNYKYVATGLFSMVGSLHFIVFLILFHLFKVHIYMCVYIYMYSWYHFSHIDYYIILSRISSAIQ